MGCKRSVLWVVPLLIAISAAIGRAEDPAKNIRIAKAATCVVVLPAESGFATAFCVDSGGYFITNYHVVKEMTAGQHLTLVLNSGETDEKSVTASAVRTDEENDLAVLKADGNGPFAPLPLGSDDLIETQAVTALGYPFGEALALEKGSRPSVSVNIAHVSSMRKSEGKLQFIQLDSQLNPGNSGGPVIDEKGNVVGVVSSGVRGAGINFAVPVRKVTALLERPQLSFTPPVILDDKIHEAINLAIRAVPFGKPRLDMTVEIVLSTPGGGERTFLAQRGSEKDVFTAHVIPVPPRPANQVAAELTFADGSVHCWADDQAIRLDGKVFKLSQLSRMEFRASGATLTNRDGSTVSGTMLAMTPLNARFGSYTVALDASKALSLTIAPRETGTPSVRYHIIAKSKGASIAELKGMLLGTANTIADANQGGATDAANSGSATGPGGPWINLAGKINVKRDTDVGDWILSGNVLRNVEQRKVESTRLTIPVKPTGNYVFEFTFERSENGKDLCAAFPVGGHGALIWIGGFDGQQSWLDGTSAKGRGDIVKIMAGKPYHVEITVQNHEKTSDVKMKLNGVDFLDWTGDPAQLQVNAGRATRDGRTLGLAVCHHTVVEFANMRVRALTGTIAAYVAGE